MKIEVLYFENCPNHVPTLERIHQVLREEGCDAEVREVLVPDVETARNVRFLGSPTVRVNGIDIEPNAGTKGFRVDVPPIPKRNTFPRIDSGSSPVSIGCEGSTMNNIRFVIDSSLSAIDSVEVF